MGRMGRCPIRNKTNVGNEKNIENAFFIHFRSFFLSCVHINGFKHLFVVALFSLIL